MAGNTAQAVEKGLPRVNPLTELDEVLKLAPNRISPSELQHLLVKMEMWQKGSQGPSALQVIGKGHDCSVADIMALEQAVKNQLREQFEKGFIDFCKLPQLQQPGRKAVDDELNAISDPKQKAELSRKFEQGFAELAKLADPSFAEVEKLKKFTNWSEVAKKLFDNLREQQHLVLEVSKFLQGDPRTVYERLGSQNAKQGIETVERQVRQCAEYPLGAESARILKAIVSKLDRLSDQLPFLDKEAALTRHVGKLKAGREESDQKLAGFDVARKEKGKQFKALLVPKPDRVPLADAKKAEKAYGVFSAAAKRAEAIPAELDQRIKKNQDALATEKRTIESCDQNYRSAQAQVAKLGMSSLKTKVITCAGALAGAVGMGAYMFWSLAKGSEATHDFIKAKILPLGHVVVNSAWPVIQAHPVVAVTVGLGLAALYAGMTVKGHKSTFSLIRNWKDTVKSFGKLETWKTFAKSFARAGSLGLLTAAVLSGPITGASAATIAVGALVYAGVTAGENSRLFFSSLGRAGGLSALGVGIFSNAAFGLNPGTACLVLGGFLYSRMSAANTLQNGHKWKSFFGSLINPRNWISAPFSLLKPHSWKSFTTSVIKAGGLAAVGALMMADPFVCTVGVAAVAGGIVGRTFASWRKHAFQSFKQWEAQEELARKKRELDDQQTKYKGIEKDIKNMQAEGVEVRKRAAVRRTRVVAAEDIVKKYQEQQRKMIERRKLAEEIKADRRRKEEEKEKGENLRKELLERLLLLRELRKRIRDAGNP